jgi:hypothetical protein
MTQRDVEISDYKITLYSKPVSVGLITGLNLSECHGTINLFSKTTLDGYYLLIASNSITTIPEPKTYNYGNYMLGSSVIKYENIHTILDILRNEKPLFMRIDDTVPSRNLIYSGREPVGEGIDVSP